MENKSQVKAFISELVKAHIHAITQENDALGIIEKPRTIRRKAERLVRKKIKKLKA